MQIKFNAIGEALNKNIFAKTFKMIGNNIQVIWESNCLFTMVKTATHNKKRLQIDFQKKNSEST